MRVLQAVSKYLQALICYALLLPAALGLRLVLLTPSYPCDPSAVLSLRAFLSRVPPDSIDCTLVIRPEIQIEEILGIDAAGLASYVSGFASLSASFPNLNLRTAINSPALVDAALSNEALAASLLKKVDGVHFKETQLLSAPASALGLCREGGLDMSLSTHSLRSYRRCEELLDAEGLQVRALCRVATHLEIRNNGDSLHSSLSLSLSLSCR